MMQGTVKIRKKKTMMYHPKDQTNLLHTAFNCESIGQRSPMHLPVQWWLVLMKAYESSFCMRSGLAYTVKYVYIYISLYIYIYGHRPLQGLPFLTYIFIYSKHTCST